MFNFNEKFQKHDPDTPVEELWVAFREELAQAIDKYIPYKMSKPSKDVPWLNKRLKCLIRKQKKLFQKQKGCAYKSRASQHYRNFKSYVQKTFRSEYWKYVEGIITTTGDNEPQVTNKRFWSFIKSRRQDSQGVAPLRSEGRLTDDSIVKANLLNQQFKSAFSPQTPLPLRFLCDQLISNSNDQPQMQCPVVNVKGINKLLKKLKPHKACGPDMLRPKVLLELADELTPIITTIFNASLTQQCVPMDWRSANVVPIFKKGDKHSAINYRPVSLTCILSKTFEHVMASNIMSFLNEHNLLYNFQHGFREKRSCETQLLEFTSDIFKNLQSGQQTDAIVMDFSKAFDRVSHNRLLYKLEMMGIHKQVVGLVRENTISGS